MALDESHITYGTHEPGATPSRVEGALSLRQEFVDAEKLMAAWRDLDAFCRGHVLLKGASLRVDFTGERGD